MAEPQVNDPNTAHEPASAHSLASWIAVSLLIAACAVLGLAFVWRSVPLAVVGAVLGVVGLVMAKVFNIMEDVH